MKINKSAFLFLILLLISFNAISQNRLTRKCKKLYPSIIDCTMQLVSMTHQSCSQKMGDSIFIHKKFNPDKLFVYTKTTESIDDKRNRRAKTTEWYDDGSLWTVYHKTKNRGMISYKKNGRFSSYFRTLNVVKTSGNYLDDLKHGIWTSYDTLGTVVSTTEYTNEARDMHKIYYNKEGEISAEYFYSNDSLINEIHNDTIQYCSEEVMPYFKSCGNEKMEDRDLCTNQILGSHLQKKIRYPNNSRKKEVTGKAYITFAIYKDGSISDFTVLRGINNDIEKECLRVLRTLPEWSAGSQDGILVNVKFTLPINFILE